MFVKIGASSSSDSLIKESALAEAFQGVGTGFCKIYTSSNFIHTEQKQFNLGWKADILANIEGFYNNTVSVGEVAWTSFNNLIAYPRIILFEERWLNGSGTGLIK